MVNTLDRSLHAERKKIRQWAEVEMVRTAFDLECQMEGTARAGAPCRFLNDMRLGECGRSSEAGSRYVDPFGVDVPSAPAGRCCAAGKLSQVARCCAAAGAAPAPRCCLREGKAAAMKGEGSMKAAPGVPSSACAPEEPDRRLSARVAGCVAAVEKLLLLPHLRSL